MVAPLAANLAFKGALGLARAALGDASPSAGPKGPRDAKAQKTADDFETMFLEQMLDRMVETAGAEGPLGENGTGGGVYRSMLVKEYAGAIGKSGGVGLSDSVYSEILKLQEGHADVGRS
ncbi:rod-binding protein [Salinarimonas soli]|uniref:Flagellar biosynthesis protein FlgJ n=1 Tax=Salinarimonas soli TaxID=1638099 RepID=A0A5B2W0N3_9HYPH|nr:rod-binding protein [Salinarimonas soli]KAA2244182.1 flagellar biosynthesis protein FlgJ [Salinarimonas soli]